MDPNLFLRHPHITYENGWTYDQQPTGTVLIPLEAETGKRVVDVLPNVTTAQWRRSVQNELLLSHSFYRANMNAMIERAQREGVEVILCSLISNLKDFPPVLSSHWNDLSQEDKTSFDAFEKEGEQAFAQKQWGKAQGAFEKALAIDDTVAHIHYRLGQIHLLQKEIEKARRFFTRAKDHSPVYAGTQRAPSELNDIIFELSQDGNTHWVDLIPVFEKASKMGVPGLDLFVDNLHPTVKGHSEIAKALMPVVRDIVESPRFQKRKREKIKL